jgi:hypothetical protein
MNYYNQFTKQLFLIVILGMLLSCQGNKTSNNISSQLEKSKNDTLSKVNNGSNSNLNGYDELSNEDNRENFVVSEYNSDMPDIPNIKRPSSSIITNFKFSKDELFKSWVENPSKDTPNTTFVIDEKSFYVADYDGDGSMPYQINNDSLIVYFNDFIKRAKIIELSNDKLIMHWDGAKKPTRYYEWKN